MKKEANKARIKIKGLQLVKWDGDPPAPGEYKEPKEILTFKDDVLVSHIIRGKEQLNGTH